MAPYHEVVPQSKIYWAGRVETEINSGHCKAYQVYKERVLLSQDVPSQPDEHYRIPELGIDCSYNEAYEMVAGMVWHFNAELAREEQEYRHRLHLPAVYDAIHVRGGDKVMETELIDGSRIIQTLSPDDGTTVFVLTDDYRQFRELQSKFPNLTFKTTCRPDEKGYHHKAFVNSSPSEKRKTIARLLISVDLLLNSRGFVGSITTGPSVFVMKRRLSEASVLAVDCPKEELASTLSLTIDARAAISMRNVSAT